MKSLLPSLREKKRYVVFEVIGDASLQKASAEIMRSASKLLGDLGMSKANIRFMNERFDPGLKKGVLRVNRKYVDHAKAAMALVNQDFTIKTAGVSGTLKKACLKFMKKLNQEG